jgi:excisionase family DNA binding protein
MKRPDSANGRDSCPLSGPTSQNAQSLGVGDAVAIACELAQLREDLASVLALLRREPAGQRDGRRVPAKRLLSLREAAKLLGVGRDSTLARWIQRGWLRAVVVEGKQRIPAAEIDRVCIEGVPAQGRAPPLARQAPPKCQGRRPDSSVGTAAHSESPGAAIRRLKL